MERIVVKNGNVTVGTEDIVKDIVNPILVETSSMLHDHELVVCENMSLLRLRDRWVPVLDHHGQLSGLPPATWQAYSLLRSLRRHFTVITEPPIDPDMATATAQVTGTTEMSKWTVLTVAIEDERGPFGLWWSIKVNEFLPRKRDVDVGVSIVSRMNVNKWPSDTEETVTEMERALEIINEEVNGASVTSEEFVREFEEQLESIDVEVIAEGGKKHKWAIVVSNDPVLQWGYSRGYQVIASYSPKMQRVTVGQRPVTGEEKTVYDMIRPPKTPVDLRELFQYMNRKHREGWGGRKDIGGSPKDHDINEEEFTEEVAKIMETWLREKLG